MDNYTEQLVKKNTETKDIVKKSLVIAAGFTVAVAFMTAAFATGFLTLILLSVLVAYGTVMLLGNMNYEYEYIVTNNDLDVDKIIGRKKRKRLITLKLDTALEFGICKDGTEGKDVSATVVASDGTNINTCYLIVNHATHGKTMLLFSPDKRTIEVLMSGLPHSMRKNVENCLKELETASENA